MKCSNCGINIGDMVGHVKVCPRCLHENYTSLQYDWVEPKFDHKPSVGGFEGYRLPVSEHIVKRASKFMNDILGEVPGGSTPSQYSLPEGAKELQDLIEYREMNFAIGNIFKACFRMKNCSHSDAKRDLNKIIWFAERELKRIK